MFAPLFIACCNSSNTTIPAPSLITKPLLSLSKGREAFVLSVSFVSAVRLEKPATPIGVMALSVPPATITSASPYFIVLKASPIQ